MLLAGRRRTLLTVCLAGLQMAWFTTYVMLALPGASALPPLVVFACLLGALLAWLALLEGLNRLHVPSPSYELAVAGLLLFSTLLFDRVLLYPGRPAGDIAWLGDTIRTLFNLSSGAGRVVVILVANVVVWQRAVAFTSEEPSFFSTGLSFRLGLLLLMFGSALLHALGRADPAGLVWAYFALGLTAVALARIEDRSAGAQSLGAPLPAVRLGQLLLTVGLTVGVAALASRVYNRQSLVIAFIWLEPLWRVVGFVLTILFTILWWLLMPVMNLLELLLRRLAESGALEGLSRLADALAAQSRAVEPRPETFGLRMPAWAWTAVRYTVVTLALLVLVGSVLLWLDHMRAARVRKEAEEQHGEPLSLGGGLLDTALGRLRDLASLVRHYGVGRQFLAAVSVQNIYANVSRLARLRGHARRPAQPPDDYLPVLRQAFPGADQPLERITAAYMRVHYGDRTISMEELAGLRADYHRIRRVPRSDEARAASAVERSPAKGE